MNPTTGKVAWSVRGFLIYLLALPLLPALMITFDQMALWPILTVAGSLSLFVAGGLCVRFGNRRQRRRALSRYTRSDTHPLTWAGCVAVAAGCFVAQYFVVDKSLLFSAAVGALGFLGAFLSYGSMWGRARAGSADGYSSDEVVAALREAEVKVQDIEAVYLRLPHGDIRRKLKRLSGKTHRLMHTIEREPKQLRKARKFLNVFLPGVQTVAKTYQKSLETNPDPEFDQRFRELLDKTDEALNRHQAQRDDRVAFDLDVQMEVLRTQLDQEIRR